MTDSDSSSGTSSEVAISAYFVFFSALLSLVLVLSKLLQDHARLARILPEAGMILMVGMATGLAMHLVYGDEGMGGQQQQQQDDDDGNVQAFVTDNLLSFSPNAFFVALLPPIIFNSGYHLQKELLFRHLWPIALLAVVGTLVSTLMVALILKTVTMAGWQSSSSSAFVPTFSELLTFGALISATDPVSTLAVFQAKRVDPQLFYLVFGESVLNDAVGLVLFETFRTFVQRDNGAGKIAMGFVEFLVGFTLDAVASPLLGWSCALGAALLFKHVDFQTRKSNRLLELALFLLIMYVPFLVAECLGLSGIVTILVSGIAARHYVEPNLSTSTQDMADVIFRLAAHIAETSIFLELGLSVVGVTKQSMEWRFLGWSLLACLVARACHVYPIAYLHNQSLRLSPTDANGNSTTSASNSTSTGTTSKDIGGGDTDPVANISDLTFFGYNYQKKIREGVDGIMKTAANANSNSSNKSNDNNYDVGQDYSAATDDNDNNDDSTSSPHKQLFTVRKPMSGNLELAEHLNDFSPHHQQQQDPERGGSTGGNIDPRGVAPQTLGLEETTPGDVPPIHRTPTTDSDTTLTPVPQRDLRLQSSTAHMVWFSGLRGAVAYACVRSFPDTFGHENEFMCTTMMIVLITVFVMGGATEFVLKWLDIEMDVNEDQYMEAWRQSEQAPAPSVWTYLDKRFVQRYVIRDYDPACAKNLHVLTGSPIKTKEMSSSLTTGHQQHQRTRNNCGGNSIVGANSIVASNREESSRSDVSSQRNQRPLEMTLPDHYDTLQEDSPPARRRTSLFDYGMKSD